MRMPAALLPLAAAAQMLCVPPFPPDSPVPQNLATIAGGDRATGSRRLRGVRPRDAERREQTRYYATAKADGDGGWAAKR